MDYNNDGMLDIIVGERYGQVHYYRRTSESPITLTKETDLICGATTINVGYNSAPVCVDWDEDGKRDLLVGNESPGNIRLYINESIDDDPVYNNYSLIESSGSSIIHYRNCPQVYDMNLDGKKDILIGVSGGQIYYYENTGTNDNPVFSGSELIISTGGGGARLWVDDWNEDGLPDVLASNYYGYIRVYIQLFQSIEGEETSAVRTLAASRNPFANSVVISGNGFCNGTISIYDLLGRVVLSEPFTGSLEWNSSEASAGCYFAEVRDTQGSAVINLLKL
ncbi:MAG: T9SS type A sorting domain-containing protein [Candidatus Aegiribacteria sp.]|nr:T9SS type A sorting domain-containing protein [Candidatus Aegiribacteria sp.]